MKFVAALTWLLCTLCECSRDSLEDAEYLRLNRFNSEEAHPPQIWQNDHFTETQVVATDGRDLVLGFLSAFMNALNENVGGPDGHTDDGDGSRGEDNEPRTEEDGSTSSIAGENGAPENLQDVPFGTPPYTWPEGHTPFIPLESHAQSNVQDLVPGQDDQPAETGQTTPNNGTDGGENNGMDGGSLPLLADFIGVVISGISENTQVQIVTQGGETSSEETSIPSSASSTTIILDISNPSEVDILKGEQNGMYERVFTPMGDRRITSIRDSNMLIWSAEVYESCRSVKHYRKDGRELLSLETTRLSETQRRCFAKNGEWMSITERDFMNQLQVMRNGNPGDDPDEGTSNLRGAMTTPFEGTSSVSDVETPSTGDGESVETISEDSQATVHPEGPTEPLENEQPEDYPDSGEPVEAHEHTSSPYEESPTDHPSETAQETAPGQVQSTFQAT